MEATLNIAPVGIIIIASPWPGIKDGIVNATVNAKIILYGLLGIFVFASANTTNKPIIK
ncbi:MAG: hypothetical protein L3J22_03600 [Xanthomonadales bacterium]|nr:hypothetical protein [Xanthomonadales bacterium]